MRVRAHIKKKRWLLTVLLLLLAVRLVGRFAYVGGSSMATTLFPGDVVYVQHRYPWTPEDHVPRGAVLQLRLAEALRPYGLPSNTLIKRVVAGPGDRVRIRGDRIWINGHLLPLAAHMRSTWRAHLSEAAQHDAVSVYRAGLSVVAPTAASGTFVVGHASAPEIQRLQQRGLIRDATRRLRDGGFDDDVRLPRAGETRTLSPKEARQWAPWLEAYEQVDPPDDGPFTHTFRHGYCYVLGDNRHASIDSRTFGPVPTSALVGRARRVMLSFARERRETPADARLLTWP